MIALEFSKGGSSPSIAEIRDVFPSPVPPTIATKLPTGMSMFISANVGFGEFGSHEKLPFFIEIAGSPGSRGGLGNRVLSSAKSSSSKRCKDTYALTAYKENIQKH